MQAGAEIPEKLLTLLATPATSIAVIYFYDRFIARKRNGPSVNVKELTQHLDLTITEHFDQLRRDLETKISKEHDSTRKDWENALQRFLLDLELFVVTGERPLGLDRRRKPRE